MSRMQFRVRLLSLAVAILVAANHIPGSASLAVMSVDLSSEWLKIALVKPGVPMEIILNKESRRKTPVMVSIRNGEVQFGDAALAVGTKYPQNAYFYMQHILAKKLDSPAVKNYLKRFPYVKLGEDEERGTVYFESGEERYYPEELLSIVLNKSRALAEEFAEQKIKEIVITVPPFFNQAERESVMYAAELADLKVLQLINDNAAVALNYGVFRRNDFNTTVTNVMFFDMGAGSTTATVVSYQVVKTKEKGISETNPHLFVKGVGFDRTLGGLEIDLRLRDHLAKKFNEAGKTKKNVFENPRAMAKLFKEANRVKKVLSANVDHFAQVEGVLDEVDLRVKVTRAELEEMCGDLFERIAGVVEMALKSSEMTMGEIDSVILVGGGTRVPKVQEKLLQVTKKGELAKNINADEAAAMGAVYQAAHLSKGFKVKKFVIRDANLFPIQVEFERHMTDDDGSEVTRVVKRTLFGRNNPFPQKKVMTFNRHMTDFSFIVGYKDLESILPPEDLESFGPTNLTTYTLKGVADALEKQSGAEPKGIKAHFRLDESGILFLDSVESVFEKMETVMEEVNDTEEEQSTLQKLSSTISRFFSGSSDDSTADSPPQEGDKAGENGAMEEEKDTSETGTSERDSSDKDTSEKDATEGQETGEPKPAEDEKVEDKEADDTNESTEGQTGEEKEEMKEQGETEETQEEEGGTEDQSEGEAGQGTKDEADSGDSDTKEASETAEDEKVDGGEETSSGEESIDSDAKADIFEKDGQEEKKTEDSKKKTKKDKKKDKKGKKGKESKEEKKEKRKIAKPKVITIKENLTVETQAHGIPKPSRESRKTSRNKLKDLQRKEEERLARETALNSLESFIYDMQDKLYQEDYETCSTEEEREGLLGKLREASDWLYEVEDDAPHTIFRDKMKELKKATKSLSFRVKERRERPQLIGELKQLQNVSQIFLAAAKNASEELKIFTDVEIGLLEKAYNDSLEWYAAKSLAQRNTPDTEKPVLLTEDLKTKITALDRELRYLVNKAKAGPPKKKDKPKDKTKKKKKNVNETETTGEENTKDEKTNDTESSEPTEKPAATPTEDKSDVPETIEPDSDQAGQQTQEETLQLPAPEEEAKVPSEETDKNTEDTESTESTTTTTAETNTDTSRNTGDL
ncbi:hypoxia up-regulated protein 1-like [Acanthaster planci]|uniref:Hypoxia up-regulated protein 1 n=1 Tax=Acanthaster planci TaxID=133434 RepID=A0A8B7ZVA8_ACAPL|nr:hypoxia up-regulated protein 1-like [Acanthaster planci]